MAYYDQIASAWHRHTGRTGGAFRVYVLNEFLLDLIGDIDDLALLELGAGNGYFQHLLHKTFPGARARQLIISDISARQLGYLPFLCKNLK